MAPAMTANYKIRYLFTILALCIFSLSTSGQTYSGTQLGRSKRLNCLLRINADSTVNFIYDQDENGLYAEYLGTIKRVSDSIFHIAAVMTLGQLYCMAHRPDMIYIQLEPDIAQQLGQITLTYSNGVFSRLSGYDRRGRSKMRIKVPMDQNLFNSTKGTDYYTLSIPDKHPITGKSLVFKIYNGSVASFQSGKKIDFEVRIKNGVLWTVGEPPLETGHFKLRKKADSGRNY
jgi:hypothetical protein